MESQEKKPYTPPQLKVWGSLREITRNLIVHDETSGVVI
jgi:hypothetical protein